MFLGQRGHLGGRDVIELAFKHPATAAHLAAGLLEYFAVLPTEDERRPFEELLRATEYQIRPTLRVLFCSRWFYSGRVVGQLQRNPLDLVVGTMRAQGHRAEVSHRLADACAAMGYALYDLDADNEQGAEEGDRAAEQRARVSRYLLVRGHPSWRYASAEDVLASLERRYLAVPLDGADRATLTGFLTGADGTAPFDLSDEDSARVKVRGALVRLASMQALLRY